MKVSVIIPLYNQSSYIKRAVESALARPETAEVIVIDDGSDDGGAETVKHLMSMDGRVKLLAHKNGQRKGAGASRNLGVRHATNAYLAFLDADDYMLPNRFAQTKVIFGGQSDADGVCEALGREGSTELTMLRRRVGPDRLFFEMEPFGKSGHFSVCGLTVKAGVFRETGGFSERLEIAEDTEWLARLVLTHRIFCGKPDVAVARRTVDGRNTTAVSERKLKDKVLMAAMLLRWAKDENRPAEVTDILLGLFLKYHYEENRLLSKKSPWSRKRADLKALFFLAKTDPRTLRRPKVKYFLKTVLGIPVREHLDYYR